MNAARCPISPGRGCACCEDGVRRGIAATWRAWRAAVAITSLIIAVATALVLVAR